MDRTDAKPLQSSRSSSSSSTKQKYGERKTEVSYPVQESLSRQESAYSSMGSSDGNFSLRSGSEGDFQRSPKPANGPRSMGDSGFVRLVVEFVFLNPTMLLIPEFKNCDF